MLMMICLWCCLLSVAGVAKRQGGHRRRARSRTENLMRVIACDFVVCVCMCGLMVFCSRWVFNQKLFFVDEEGHITLRPAHHRHHRQRLFKLTDDGPTQKLRRLATTTTPNKTHTRAQMCHTLITPNSTTPNHTIQGHIVPYRAWV